MKLLADESVDLPIVNRLRLDGHGVICVAELAPSLSDEAVLELANRENALLLTADKDFGELVFRQGRVHAGVILLRLMGLAATAKSEIVASTIKARESELAGSFSVISPALVRIRRTA
jgi:predicted nuclease of predicted toxin-antitoxin system